VECTIDNVFNLRDLVLQELVKITNILYKKLKIKMLNVALYTTDFKDI